MIDIRLSHALLNTWQTEEGISVTGAAFLEDVLLKHSDFIRYFRAVKDEADFVQKIKMLSGHFSVIIELEQQVLAATDIIRTIPLFFSKNKNGYVLTDRPDNSKDWNETEAEHFRKVYCTLENNTLLNDWFQLQAGEYLVMDKAAQTHRLNVYYHHTSDRNATPDTQALKKLEERIIRNALQYADGRTIVIPLSGGYDSRYLLCLLKESNYPHIICFTYGRKDSYEVKTAQKVAEQLQVPWHFTEYTDELLSLFFSNEWKQYSDNNHHFTSLPHEQDFFALHALLQQKSLPENAVIMNGFCQDILTGSFLEEENDFNMTDLIFNKYRLRPDLSAYENSWNGYQEWLVKNRLSKFIINSVRVYSYHHLDFYLPFWQKDWTDFWYGLSTENRLHQQFYTSYLFNGIFKRHQVEFKKPSFDSPDTNSALRNRLKEILPAKLTTWIQRLNQRNTARDSNNTLYLYDAIYHELKDKPAEMDFSINHVHAVRFLEKLRNPGTP